MARFAPTVATAGLALALLAAVVLLIAGPGYRFGLWSLGTGFALMRYAAFGGIAAAVVSAIGLVLARPRGRRRGMFRALAGLVIGLIAVGVPWSYARSARAAPPIHDITTDLADPPAFAANLPLRADAPNPADYGGAEVAAQQRESYPDIGPLVVAPGPQRAYAAALAAALEMDWQVVAADEAAGRIEATDRTWWFGFTDDVVVRIRPEGAGSRIDVRSSSRVGVGDAGTNAARIRAYLEEVREQLEEAG
ncbi:MAG TPA: DUF1499 domain-containing protein [Geminicoccaceae bacterium]|nr:DUF1499 domain-containing protein [Geminicoccaceae bacterium]